MQSVNDVINEFRKTLIPTYERGELEQIIFLAFEHVCGFSKTDLVLIRDEQLSGEKVTEFRKIAERLKKQEPIQYIIGSTEFYGLPIKVNSHVLIPRQETEELVDMIIKEARIPPLGGGGAILDICTGSGCIAIVLKKNIPQSTVYAIDISDDALKVADENSKLNQTPKSFIQAEIFQLPTSNLQLPNNLDIIVSNPPYVLENEKKEMTDRELNYEPHLAFFTEGDDALIFYRQIAELATQHLTSGGKLYFEINEQKGKEIVELLTSKGFKEVTLKQDLNGKDRMISCRYDGIEHG